MEHKELLKYIRLFREKANTNKLIIFVGAGVSCNVKGMPSWRGLVEKMDKSIGYFKCTDCEKKKKGCKQDCKEYNNYSSDELLKIPQYVYNKSKKRYNKILEENIMHDMTIDAPISKEIFNLAPAHIITTNYDRLLENCSNIQKENYAVVIRDKDLLDSTKSKYIIKMHGDISNLDTIVLKEADYLNYTQDHVLIEMFVKSLLANHTFLFLGYTLNDYNIKLIINWINYIRDKNKALSKDTKFGYIALDVPKVSKIQQCYFEKNNIGVINLNTLSLIENIPIELTDDRGKRLYSFLKIIGNPHLENVFDSHLLYDDVVQFMSNYSYIDIKSICELLYFKNYFIEGKNLVLFYDEVYDNLISYINSDTDNAKFLSQCFCDAGVENIVLSSFNSQRRESYEIKNKTQSLLSNPYFSLYLSNKYKELSDMSLSKLDNKPFEACFYISNIYGYTKEIFKCYENIEHDKLAYGQKVNYLFNYDTLKSVDGIQSRRDFLSFINGASYTRIKVMNQMYKDILEGNTHRLLKIKNKLEKLKESYYHKGYSFAGSSLDGFYEIQAMAIEQYMFYFNNTIFFKKVADLKKFLLLYIEAIICTNGQIIEEYGNSIIGDSYKERYAINKIDIDIITKFSSIRELSTLLNEYKLEKFLISAKYTDYIIMCFKNITYSIINMNLYNCDSSSIFINYALLLNHIPLNDCQKECISTLIQNIYSNAKFIKHFGYFGFPEHLKGLNIIIDLMKTVEVNKNIKIAKLFIVKQKISDYLTTFGIKRMQSFLSIFLGSKLTDEEQDEFNTIIEDFDNKDKLNAIKMIYKFMTKKKYREQYKKFISDNFSDLNENEIFKFVFDDMLEITTEKENELKKSVISLYNQKQKSHVIVYPDPIEKKLSLICVLYMTKKIKSLDEFKNIKLDNDFIDFFLEPNNFDYSKVDFSNYMWENIARQPWLMERIVEHKDMIIPLIRKKVEMDTATEFEKKVLYGVLLGKSALL